MSRTNRRWTRRAARAALGVVLITGGLNLRWNFGWRFPGAQAGVDIRYGYLEIGWPRDLPSVAFTVRDARPAFPLLPVFSISRRGDGSLSSPQYHQAAVPLWYLASLLAIAARPRRARRRRPGRCGKCGYDLAGLTAETACPECGAPRVAPFP